MGSSEPSMAESMSVYNKEEAGSSTEVGEAGHFAR